MSEQSTHQIHNPDHLAPAIGFAHAVAAANGRTVYLGGQTALDGEGRIVGETIAEQFDQAAANVLGALHAAGGRPEHLVSLQVFTTDIGVYKASLRELAAVYRRHFGYHYPAMALIGVRELFDAEARVELMGIAVIPQATDG
jgi:enamine deaminase RidA (YjgF/YER057c/UK114 family)